jgi:hypothetical protein
VSKIKEVNDTKTYAFLCLNILFTRVWVPEQINVREYRRGNQKRTINRNRQHRVRYTRRRQTKQKHNTICIGRTNLNLYKKIFLETKYMLCLPMILFTICPCALHMVKFSWKYDLDFYRNMSWSGFFLTFSELPVTLFVFVCG